MRAVVLPLFMAAVLLGSPARAELKPVNDDLVAAACPFDVSSALEGRLRCFQLTVPRRYDQPARGTYKLTVAIRRASQPRPGLLPTLWLHGGPGGGITPAVIDERLQMHPGADVVFFASRGARSSEPRPCDDLDAKKVAAFAGQLPLAERVRRYSAPYLECRTRLDRLGIRVDEFNTALNTEDIERLRRALGVDRWDIWTGSYGTGSASDLIARYPQTVRSAVLMSPIAPEDTPEMVGPRAPKTDPIGALSRHCRADPACVRRFPDLAQSAAAARATLVREPIVLDLLPAPYDAERFHLDGDMFDWLVSGMMGSSSEAVKLPRLLSALAARRADVVAEFVRPALAGAARATIFGRASFHCAERPQFHRDQDVIDGERMTQLIGVCPAWTPLQGLIRIPRETSVPTLVMPGEFDSTPPRNGVALAPLLGRRSQLVIVPGESHMPYLRNDCARRIVHAFLEEPLKKIDRTCLATSRPPAFQFLD